MTRRQGDGDYQVERSFEVEDPDEGLCRALDSLLAPMP